MSDYQVAGEWQDDLSVGERIALPALVAWTKREDAKWLRDGEFVLHYRTRGLSRPRRSQHADVDEVMAAARGLPKWCQFGEGRRDTRVTFRDLDPASGVDPYTDTAREELLRRANEGDVSLERERRLAPRAVGRARQETNGGATTTEKMSFVLVLLGWLLGRGEPPAPRQDQEVME